MSTETTVFTAAPDFERASRLKLRFDSPKGQLTIEDLWDLPLTSPIHTRANLDSIAISLHRQTRETAETISFVTPSTENERSAELFLKFEVVKRVITVKVAERDQAKEAADRRAKKQRILELIASKQDKELEDKPIEELRALAESL